MDEPVGIDPKVDCVFKAVLGSDHHKPLLLDFLNAVLNPASPIVDVEIRNPFNPPTFVGDGTTIVDVKARDASGRVFQVEMQNTLETAMKPRFLYSWSDTYLEQLGEGGNYSELRPVVSIWLMGANTFRRSTSFHHRFVVYDPARGVRLSDHLEIHTLELRKWQPQETLDPMDRWMYFFQQAESWSAPPPNADTPILREAMSILQRFKDNAEMREIYRARRAGLLLQRTREKEMLEMRQQAQQAQQQVEQAQQQVEQAQQQVEQAQQQVEQAQQQAEQAQQQAERERQEKERLLEILRRLGVQPE